MRLRRRLFFVLALLCSPLPLFAHIGSSTVVYDGTAGPYAVRVIVRPAPVVPGRAQIDVRLLQEESGPVKVTVLPVNGRVGLKGAPAPDDAQPVKGDASLRHAELWLMTGGSYSVHVAVSGARGSGTAIVPVVAVATRQLPMPPWLGAMLGVLGVGLFLGAVNLVRLAVGESVAADDAARTTAQRRRGWIAAALAFLVFGTGIYGGKRWWDAEDRNYRNNQLYRPRPLTAEVARIDGQPVLKLDITPAGERGDRVMLIPDHGKLMHLFLIREPELDALAHLHPMRNGPHTFVVAPPPLPAGRYRLYADVTNESGFAATLTTTVELPALPADVAAGRWRDPDDSWFEGTPEKSPAAEVTLSLRNPKELHAGEDLTLNFVATAQDGSAVELEPYMGMLGHAAVRRSDGSVFSHLHPVGTISMAAQAYFAASAARDNGTPPPEDHSAHMAHAATDSLAFPYLFPQEGAYRIWVQTKARGRVVTGVFDVNVRGPR